MTKVTLSILLFFTGIYPCIAQDVVSIDYLLETPVKTIDKYKLNSDDTSVVYIPFDFSSGDSEVIEMIDSMLSRSVPIEKIDFVYTKFRQSEDFNQMELNRNRFEQLREFAPYIFDNNVIEWDIYEQTNTLGLEENKRLFHGFAVHFLNEGIYFGNDGPMTTDEEIDAIYAYLESVYRADSTYEMGGGREIGGGYIPISKRKREDGIRYKKKLFGLWRKYEDPIYDTTWVSTYSSGRYVPMINDTVVTRTLRNYEDQWNCDYVVEDVTGSMYPYIAQTLAWKKLKLETSSISHFVFFNDGDANPDGPIGKSGGAYYIESHDFEEIGEKVTEVMRKGYGGGAPENNVEATLFAEKKFDESDSYILIADNNAPVRDMSISGKITKPTHIILCGVRNGRIHHSYINLAIMTGGTLHTIEEDIVSINKLEPGDTFEMGGQKFKFNSVGSIELVR